METRQDLVCSPYWQVKSRHTINSRDNMGGTFSRVWGRGAVPPRCYREPSSGEVSNCTCITCRYRSTLQPSMIGDGEPTAHPQHQFHGPRVEQHPAPDILIQASPPPPNNGSRLWGSTSTPGDTAGTQLANKSTPLISIDTGNNGGRQSRTTATAKRYWIVRTGMFSTGGSITRTLVAFAGMQVWSS